MSKLTDPFSQTAIPAQPAGVKNDGAYDSIAPPRVFAEASVFQVVFSFATMLGVCLVARVFYAMRSFTVDPDVWWHIKYGQSILTTHQWPTIEQFSFTAQGQRWLSYEWVGDVLLAAVYQHGGLRGLGALLIVLAAIFALALYFYTSIRCGNPKAGFVATVLLFNLADFCNLRPQMLGYVFLMITLIVLERFRQCRRAAIWLLPPLMIVWINTHGSWVIGLGAIAVYLVGGLFSFRAGSVETRKWGVSERGKLVWVFVLSVIATVITPYGTRLATYPFLVASKVPVSIRSVEEWQPITFSLPGTTLFLALVIVFFSAQVLVRPKWRLEELGLFLFAAVLPFIHMRFLALFVAFSAPIFVVILARWIPKYDRAKELYGLNAAIIVGLAAAMVWYFPSRSYYEQSVEKSFPVEAVQYLDTHSVSGPMYNNYGFGGYLIFSRGPEHKVFIDGRAEVYEHVGVMADYIKLVSLAPGSLSVLDKYNIQSCLVSPNEALATVLAALPAWQKAYEGKTSVLFVRRSQLAKTPPAVNGSREI